MSSVVSSRAEYWRGLLEEFSQSGLTVQAFCTAKGVSVPSYYQWKRKLRGPEVESSQAIVPVRLIASPARIVASHVQIVTPSGFVLRVDASVSPESLTQLLRCLESSIERGETC